MDESAKQAAPEKPADTGKELSTINRGSRLVPQTLGEAKDIAALLARADVVPKEFLGKPANILLAVMHGAEVGLSPAQALSSIMVVNNRCSIWGDSLLGIVKASPYYEWSKDTYDPKVEGGQASFTVKRKGEEALTRTFSMEDAKKAGLASKSGPWQNYPKRMLYMRARAFALRDAFGDVLKGLRVAEEERDVIEGEIVRETIGGGTPPASEARDALAQPEQPAATPAPQREETHLGDLEPKPEEQPRTVAAAPATQPAAEKSEPAKRRRF